VSDPVMDASALVKTSIVPTDSEPGHQLS
jgi:hypothetical protein